MLGIVRPTDRHGLRGGPHRDQSRLDPPTARFHDRLSLRCAAAARDGTGGALGREGFPPGSPPILALAGCAGPTHGDRPLSALTDLGLGPVGVANLTEFLPRQGLEPGDLDLGELVDRDDVLDGFELIRH